MTSTTTTPRCADPASHEPHSYYDDEQREMFCAGVSKRLPSCPDYCDGRHFGHGWEGIDDNGVPWRDHSGGSWESIRGEGKSAFNSAEVFLFCEERQGEGLGPTLVNVHADNTSLTPADAIRLAEQIVSAARVAEGVSRG